VQHRKLVQSRSDPLQNHGSSQVAVTVTVLADHRFTVAYVISSGRAQRHGTPDPDLPPGPTAGRNPDKRSASATPKPSRPLTEPVLS
jgi:hypothetical protein